MNELLLLEAAEAYRSARCPAALTGAGISVESGIPDFRSASGLWSRFDPTEYATLDGFLRHPEKSWRMFRALGLELQGKEPNAAHHALARLEREAGLKGIVTQNIDGLHQKAGSRELYEVHGEHRNLHCLRCGKLEPVRPEHFDDAHVPSCGACRFPFKPNVVLFGEIPHQLDDAQEFLARCDLLLVIGTSAEVYPVAGFPAAVQAGGGTIVEFNLEPTHLTGRAEFFIQGLASKTLEAFAAAVGR